MNPIQNIINAATPGPWAAIDHRRVGEGAKVVMWPDDNTAPFLLAKCGGDAEDMGNATFIAAFDPEHVAMLDIAFRAAIDFYSSSRGCRSKELVVKDTSRLVRALGLLVEYRDVHFPGWSDRYDWGDDE